MVSFYRRIGKRKRIGCCFCYANGAARPRWTRRTGSPCAGSSTPGTWSGTTCRSSCGRSHIARSSRTHLCSHDTSLFPGLVLRSINTDFRNQILILQHSSRSTKWSSLILQSFAKFCKIGIFNFRNFLQNLGKFSGS